MTSSPRGNMHAVAYVLGSKRKGGHGVCLIATPEWLKVHIIWLMAPQEEASLAARTLTREGRLTGKGSAWR